MEPATVDCAREISLYHNGYQHRNKLKSIYIWLVTCFPRVTVSLLCRSQVVSKIHGPIYPYLISGDVIFGAGDRHSNETKTLRKHATKSKNMR